MKKTRNNFAALDIFKVICAILIVAIHTRPFSEISGTLDFYLCDVIARIAVPYFFTASGYFLFKKLEMRNGKACFNKKNITVIKDYLFRVIQLYFTWSIIYLLYQVPYWISIGWTGKKAIIDYILSFFLNGSVYHFWYLVSLIYGTIICFFLLVCFKIKSVCIISAILYTIKCFTYSYTWLIPHLPQKNAFLPELPSKMPSVVGAFLVAVPFMIVGFIISQKEKSGNRKTDLYKLLLFAFLLIIEASILYFVTPNEKLFSYIFMSLPLSYYIFKNLLNIKITKINSTTQRTLRKISTIIYCVHPFVIYIIEILVKQPNRLFEFFATVLISAVFALAVICPKKIKILKLLY